MSGTIEVPGWWTLGKEAPVCVSESQWEEMISEPAYAEIEVRREDVLRPWGPTPTAAPLSDAGSLIDPALHHSDPAEPRRGAICSMPQATKAPNQAMALEPQKRGPEPTKREYVERRICEDIEAGKTTPEKLKKTPRKEIYYRCADMPGGEKTIVARYRDERST
jgi:hypothetical protein